MRAIKVLLLALLVWAAGASGAAAVTVPDPETGVELEWHPGLLEEMLDAQVPGIVVPGAPATPVPAPVAPAVAGPRPPPVPAAEGVGSLAILLGGALAARVIYRARARSAGRLRPVRTTALRVGLAMRPWRPI